MVIYPVDSAIQRLNNRGQTDNWDLKEGFLPLLGSSFRKHLH